MRYRPYAAVLTAALLSMAPAYPAAPTRETTLRVTRLELLDARADSFARSWGTTAPLAREILRASSRHRVRPNVAFQMVRRESSFQARARGQAGEVGLMQVFHATARPYMAGRPANTLWHPRVNLDVGFAYFRSHLDRYGNNEWLALMAYNRGPQPPDSLRAWAANDRAAGLVPYADLVLSTRGRVPSRNAAR